MDKIIRKLKIKGHQCLQNQLSSLSQDTKALIFFFFASLNGVGYHCFFIVSSCYSGLLNGFFRAYRKMEDKLSDLPDNMIHKILFFLDTKYVVLSRRRKNLRASVPDLSFDSKGFIYRTNVS